ncbi:MAG: phytanoyl-CoA dioxygenase family protein [Acidobacteriota bacterium]
MGGRTREGSRLLEEYRTAGFTIVRNAIDSGLAQELVDHVHWLGKKHPDVRPEQLHHHLLVDDPFLHRMAGDERLLDIAEVFLGSDIALFAAHTIAKRPHTGQAVPWHQDGSYWPLDPMRVTTLWVAGTASTRETGCMRVLPGTHRQRLAEHGELIPVEAETNVLGEGLDPKSVDETEAVDVELEPGDVSIHDPNLVHGSNANDSDSWRIGMTLRYIPTTTSVLNRGHRCVMLRGRLEPVVGNVYAERPRWAAGEHLAFAGCEDWA